MTLSSAGLREGARLPRLPRQKLPFLVSLMMAAMVRAEETEEEGPAWMEWIISMFGADGLAGVSLWR